MSTEERHCTETGCTRVPYRRLDICRHHYDKNRAERLRAAQPYDAVADAAHLRGAMLVAESGVRIALLHTPTSSRATKALRQVEEVIAQHRHRVDRGDITMNDVEAQAVREELRILRADLDRLRKENEELKAKLRGAA